VLIIRAAPARGDRGRVRGAGPTTAASTPPSTSVRRPPGAVRVRSAHARVGHTRLHYRVAGDGPPLILVHGYGAASSWWHRNMGPLAEQRRVYAPDLGGFGRSWPKHRFSLEGTVECLVSWMQELGLPRADFCGHSMGGHICLRLAAAHPDCVRKLVLADASGLPLNARLLQLAWRSMRSQGHTRFRFAPIALATALQAGPLVLGGALHDLLADDVQTVLSGIAAPTLLVWGERDLLVPLALGQALHRAIQGSRLVVVPGAGHNVMFECPDQFNQFVLDFLAE
jgi:pimeloyl-ACP methyl ester carboxylesterase